MKFANSQCFTAERDGLGVVLASSVVDAYVVFSQGDSQVILSEAGLEYAKCFREAFQRVVKLLQLVVNSSYLMLGVTHLEGIATLGQRLLVDGKSLLAGAKSFAEIALLGVDGGNLIETLCDLDIAIAEPLTVDADALIVASQGLLDTTLRFG